MNSGAGRHRRGDCLSQVTTNIGVPTEEVGKGYAFYIDNRYLASQVIESGLYAW